MKDEKEQRAEKEHRQQTFSPAQLQKEILSEQQENLA
jgi:hypothetical protein